MNLRAYFSTFGATALIIATTLITSVIIARTIGPEGRGVLLAITIWPGMLMGFLSLGLNEATVYHMARTSGATDSGVARRYAASGFVLQLAVAGGATALTLALLPFLVRGEYAPWLGVVLLYAAAYGPLVTLDQHFKAVVQGEGRYDALSVMRIGPPLIYAGLLIAFLAAGRLSVEMVLVGMVASFALAVAAGGWITSPSVRGASRDAMRDTLSTAARFHAGNMLTFAASEADKLIVLAMLDVKSAGYYAVAAALSPLGAAAVVQSLGIILAREMARVGTSAEHASVFVGSLLVAVFMLLAVNGLAAVLSPWWLPQLYGSQFRAAVPVVAILLLMGALKGLRQVTDRAMRGLHNASVGIAGEAVALALTVLLAFFGAQTGGLEGLAWGLVIAQSLALAVMLVLAVRVLGIRISDLARGLVRGDAQLRSLAKRTSVWLRE